MFSKSNSRYIVNLKCQKTVKIGLYAPYVNMY